MNRKKIKSSIFLIVMITLSVTLLSACQGSKSEYNYPIETTEINKDIVTGIFFGKTELIANPVRYIAEGKYEEALEFIDRAIGRSKDGVYGYYYKALYHSTRNELEDAWAAVEESLNKGLSIEVYMAGPKSLAQNLYNYSKFKKAIDDKVLIHGPMIGAVTDTSAKVWIRTWNEQPFVVEFSKNEDMRNPIVSSKGMTKREDDFTGTVEVTGLEPNMRYYYALKINDKIQVVEAIGSVPSFSTYPLKGRPAKFDVAFGACSNLNSNPKFEETWNTITLRNPLAMIQLGDNTYIDDPTCYEYQRAGYYLRYSTPQYRKLMATTSNYAIWDDHDFSINDGVSSADYDSPPWKKNVLKIWKQNFLSPYYGGGDTNPGVYTDFSVADVDFIMLDSRYYKENPLLIENASMLGPIQKQWFFDKLKNSDAKFKVIASSVPFALNVAGKSGGKDTWDGHLAEKEEIYNFIRENNIEGVIVITGDRHRADARRILVPDNYDIYEFLNARLTNTQTAPLHPDHEDSIVLTGNEGTLLSYNERPHFGLLSFDTTLEDPEVTYTIINMENKEQGSYTVKLSELTNNKDMNSEDKSQ